MRIGLISDTHMPTMSSRLHPAVPEVFRGVDMILPQRLKGRTLVIVDGHLVQQQVKVPERVIGLVLKPQRAAAIISLAQRLGIIGR